MINYRIYFFSALFFFIIFLGCHNIVQAITVSNVSISPELDISLFSNYTISADVADYSTTSPVTLTLTGTNGDGNDCWIYRADGTCEFSPLIFDMSYVSSSLWQKTIIRPDTIYPQIYFAPSSVTWNNNPLDIDLRRNNYHILHLNNPFTMVDDQSFWIEFNVEAVSLSNSADLQVYLVSKGKSISFFNSDWRNSSDVELVGTINRNTEVNHVHTDNSHHHLVSLKTNADGTVGANSLDISDEFWVILYANSPNTARGWSLKYHNQSLCNNTNGWFVGNQNGWTTVSQAGCPDAHIHLARRSDNADGVRAVVTAGAGSSTQDFSFAVLPNLSPNQSTFIMPTVGGTYEGELVIRWATSTDPNNDPLVYDLFLLDSNGDTITPALIASTSDTFFNFNTASSSDGQYSLKGYVKDGYNEGVEFSLNGNFTISNLDPIVSLTGISLASDNSSTTLAKAEDTITLSFTASGVLSTSTVVMYSGGTEITDDIVISNPSGNNWTASYVVNASDNEGEITFNIESQYLDRDYFITTDNSNVIVDITPPSDPTASPAAGTYTSEQSVTLSSVGSVGIYYTLNGDSPNCVSSSIFSEAITISSELSIKSVACDDAGNESGISVHTYVINYILSYLAGSGGSITGSSTQIVAAGSDGSAVTATANSGYYFLRWSDGSTASTRTEENVSANITLSAIFQQQLSGGGGGYYQPAVVIVSTTASSTLPSISSTNWGLISSLGTSLIVSDNSVNKFSTPISSKNWQKGDFRLKISHLDTINSTVNIFLLPDGLEAELKLGDKLEVSLDNDKIVDIEILFLNLYIDRVELSIRSLGQVGIISWIAPEGYQKISGPSQIKFFNNIINEPGTINKWGVLKSTNSSRYIFTKNLYPGLIDKDVKELQKYLNTNGFIVEMKGPGSFGNETNLFGISTKAALIKFQKAKNIKPSVGFFGPITRGVINKN